MQPSRSVRGAIMNIMLRYGLVTEGALGQFPLHRSRGLSVLMMRFGIYVLLTMRESIS